MATYQDVYARIRPDMAEGAVGRVMNVSDKTPSDIIAEKRNIEEQKQIKENSYKLQQQYGYAPSEANTLAENMVSVAKQAKQVEVQKQMLAASQAKYDLQAQQDKLNREASIQKMRDDALAIPAGDLVGHEKRLNDLRNKHWPLLTSRDPETREQAAMIISNINEENKRYGDIAESHIISLGAPKEAAHGIALSSVNKNGEYDPSLGSNSVTQYFNREVEMKAREYAEKEAAVESRQSRMLKERTAASIQRFKDEKTFLRDQDKMSESERDRKAAELGLEPESMTDKGIKYKRPQFGDVSTTTRASTSLPANNQTATTERPPLSSFQIE
jgi:hypothetical protein